MSYHAADDGQGADVLPLGGEHITVGEIPPDADVGGDVFSGVDGVISGARAMNGGLERRREVTVIIIVVIVTIAAVVNIFMSEIALIIMSSKRLPPIMRAGDAVRKINLSGTLTCS